MAASVSSASSVGRLQTDADRERVLEGLGDTGGQESGLSKAELAQVVRKLAPRWFLLRDAHAREGTLLLQPRWAMSLLLGPTTRSEIRRAREHEAVLRGAVLV